MADTSIYSAYFGNNRMASSVVKAGYWFVGSDRLPVADIPSELFTHIYAGFAKVNPDTGGVTFPNQYKQQFESFTTIVRRRNPGVKTLLSIGGDIDKFAANHISLVMKDQSKPTFPNQYMQQFGGFTTIVPGRNPGVETLLSIGGDIEKCAANHISLLMNDQNKLETFILDSIRLARSFHFDGLDLCGLYPSPSHDDANLDSFLNKWKAAVDQDAKDKTNHVPLLLTAAVYYNPVIDINGGSFSYPCDTINETLNWINVRANDFYTPSNSARNTGPVHAWSTRAVDSNRSGKDGIENWIDNGVASNKLVLCLPFYGYEWNLRNAKYSGFFAPAHPANTNPMTYRNIMPKLQKSDYVLKYDNNSIAPYAHNSDNSWIGYENECSIRGKVREAIRKNNLGGYFAWHVGADDKGWTLSTAAFNAI